MALRKLKPTTPGSRFTIRVTNPQITTDTPHKPLTVSKKKHAGRNSYGRITVRHRGGGHPQKYRIIDFKRSLDGVRARVEEIEYDPNRSALIALLVYDNGDRRYIAATEKMRKGDIVYNGASADISEGNCIPLSAIPLGTIICCIEIKPKKGAQLARSAGTYAQVLTKIDSYVTVKLRSGFVIKIDERCRAVIGTMSNSENNLRKLGKAGAKRWRGIRPTVRGVAMNPVDHPHGGGEGKTSGGRHPVSPWGQKTKGLKTRKNKRTDRSIVSFKKKRG